MTSGREVRPQATGGIGTEPEIKRRSWVTLAALGVAALVVFAALVALGTWQVYRLSWKLDLIARVDARVAAPATPPPPPVDWATVTADTDAYRHILARGTFLNDRETDVQAVTERGAGFWVMTPLRTDTGFTVLVNRGFVPEDRREPASRPLGQVGGETSVTGLLRVTEPGGAFLRHNDPAHDRWYSRDIAAIAAARGLGSVAPYFIDADPTPNPGGYPVGGLTVVAFPNNHLVYAITWYAMAAMLAGAVVWVARDERASRRRRP